MNKIDLLKEAHRRGLEIPADKKALFEEAVSRGLIQLNQPVEQEGVDFRSMEPSQTQERGIGTVLEPAATIASSIVAEPVAGLAGLASIPFADSPAGVVGSVKDALTYQPRTEGGKAGLQAVGEALAPVGEAMQAAEEFTGEAGYQAGGPLLGSVTSTLPTAALEILGLGAVRRATKAKKAAAATDDVVDTAGTGPALTRGLQSKRKSQLASEKARQELDVPADPADLQRLVDDISAEKTGRVAAAVDADPDIVKAADDLGVDLPTGATSRNRTFIETEQATKSIPGSTLAAREQAAIKKLGDKADELINDLGGTTDKGVLDFNVKARISNTVNRLGGKAEVLYNKVGDKIPKATRVSAEKSKEYIKRTLEELGGDDSLLSVPEKELMRITKIEGGPTYAALDRIRKNVGDGFKGTGPYKDAGEASLRRVYAALSDDQQAVAASFKVGPDYKMAKKLVQLRKGVEEKAIKAFGKEVNKSIIPALTSSATALTKGDVSKFAKLMDSLPKSQRRAAAATMLNDLFTLGSRNKEGVAGGVVAAYKALNRHKSAKKILFDQLPPGAEARFHRIGKVSEGLYRSIGLENKSKTARDLLAGLDSGGLVAKVYKVSKDAAKAEGVSSAIGVPGIGTSAVIGGAIVKGKTSATAAADAFLTSPSLKKAISLAADGKVAESSRMIKGSKKFKAWASHLSKRDAAQLATVGLIPWLTNQTGENKP